MPGKILDIRCQNGQAVKSGDVLFILEAMKMENEIFAGKDGTVTSVCVETGASVDTGAVLATVQ
jgi:biotin carboxyl carrier protein